MVSLSRFVYLSHNYIFSMSEKMITKNEYYIKIITVTCFKVPKHKHANVRRVYS